MIVARCRSLFYLTLMLAFAFFGWAPAISAAHPVTSGWWVSSVVGSPAAGASDGESVAHFSDGSGEVADASDSSGGEESSESSTAGVSFADEEIHDETGVTHVVSGDVPPMVRHALLVLRSHSSAPEIQPPESFSFARIV